MKKFLLLLCLCFCSLLGSFELVALQQSQALQPVTINHSQDRIELHEQIKSSIKGAQQSILIFTFTLSDQEIISLLNEKVDDGIDVVVIIDREHKQPILSLGDKKIRVFTRTSGEGRLHHKILVIDDEYVWIGSANFTESAFHTQENLMVGMFSPELAQLLRQESGVFQGKVYRDAISPATIAVGDQVVQFCLLPHDGFPAKKPDVFTNNASKAVLFDVINNAKESIQIGMMVWTNQDLANAVISAHKRGVVVEVLAPDLGGVLPSLIKAGISVKVNPKLSFMHNKFMYVDRNVLVNGSANWSVSSFTRNDESFVVVRSMSEEQQNLMDAYWEYLTAS